MTPILIPFHFLNPPAIISPTIDRQRPRSLFVLAALGMIHLFSLASSNAADLISVEGTLSGEVSWYHPDLYSPVFIPADGDSGSFSEDFFGTLARQSWSAEVTPRKSRAISTFGADFDQIGSRSFMFITGTVSASASPVVIQSTIGGMANFSSLIKLEFSTPETMTFSGSHNNSLSEADLTAHWLSLSGESWTASMDELRSGSIMIEPGILTISATFTSEVQFYGAPLTSMGYMFTFQETVIPEPSSLLLLGAAAMSFLARRRPTSHKRLL